MHDFSLVPPVDVGQFDGPLLDGKPLHEGSCEDGVYGCRKCNRAMRTLTDEQLKSMGIETETSCDWCKKRVSLRNIFGIRPWDEPSCYYEVCGSCKGKHDKELADLAD